MFNFFKNSNQEELESMLEAHRAEKSGMHVQAEKLRDEIRLLKNELKQLKLDKRIEEDEIKHKLKMREEQKEVENQKWMLEKERKFDKDIASIKNDYRDKLEDFLTKRGDDIRSMYSEILERLPNVNMRIKEDK